MRLTVEYRGGSANVVAGNTGAKDDGLWLADPWGNDFFIMSGHKPEFGAGGFEFNAPPGNGYRISVGFSFWTFDHRAGMTFLTWEGEEPTPSPEPPTPSPEPEPPTPSPEPPPTPSPEPPPDSPWPEVFRKLDLIIEKLEQGRGP